MREEAIHAGLVRRDPAALAALIDGYADLVYALCFRILAGAGSAEDVEECTSDTFHAAWQCADRYDPGRAPLRTWVLMLAKYTALKRRRRLARKAPLLISLPEPTPDADPRPEEALATAEDRRRVQAALDRLAPLDRQLVYRRYFLEESIVDLAAAFGLSRQAVDNRLWRARMALRTALGTDAEEVADREQGTP